MNIILVTGNKFKAEETRRILNIPLDVADIDLEEIQEIELEKVALHKLSKAYEILKTPVIIDDISFEIHAWNKFPGPLIKWILKAGGPELLIKMLGNEKNRKATARLAIGYHNGVEPHLFIGEVNGSISKKPKGKNGFGWDMVFIPDGMSKTFAEMEPAEKDNISHRGLALEKLSDFLKEE